MTEHPPSTSAKPARGFHCTWSFGRCTEKLINCRRKYLRSQGFPEGLVRNFCAHVNSCKMRYWLIDNSEDMNIRDGCRIRKKKNIVEIEEGASRWDESRNCLDVHVQMGAACWIPTKFRFINKPRKEEVPKTFALCVSQPGAAVNRELQNIRSILTHAVPIPSDPSQLARRIRKMAIFLKQESPRLRSENKTVTLIISTHGLPVALPEVLQDFVDSLQLLEGLPVRMVIRLCTDEESTVDFFNGLEGKLKNVTCDVLDDYLGEAVEVYLHNSWLNYGLPLHRMREAGVPMPHVMNKVDDIPLSPSCLREFCTCLLLGEGSLPDPLVNWLAFLGALLTAISREKLQWNPVRKELAPWVNVNKLQSIYGGQPFAQNVPHGPRMPRRASQPNVPQNQHQQQKQARRKSIPSDDPPAYAQQGGQRQKNGVARVSDKFAIGDVGNLETRIKKAWLTQPPKYNTTRSLQELLSTVQGRCFPPALGVEPHDYFSKWKPFCIDCLTEANNDVVKRAARKAKFFLHPDKIPKDLTEKQSLLFKTLWHAIAQAETALD